MKTVRDTVQRPQAVARQQVQSFVHLCVGGTYPEYIRPRVRLALAGGLRTEEMASLVDYFYSQDLQEDLVDFLDRDFTTRTGTHIRFGYSDAGPYVSYRRRKGCMVGPAQRLAYKTQTFDDEHVRVTCAGGPAEFDLEPEEEDYKAICFGMCLLGREYELFVRDNGLE